LRYSLLFDSPIDAYRRQAEDLFRALRAGDDEARWNFKWMHPRFRDRSVEEVRPGQLEPADAELVVAAEYGFDSWSDLAGFSRAVGEDPAVFRFETAVEAVISGDADRLSRLLREHPGLVHQRSGRRHRATLLHYLGANGVEGNRQRTPPNAVAIGRLLLEAGADPDALASMYHNQCTTLSLLVSSSPPHQAGLQEALAELLLDHGAALVGPGTAWQSAVLTALIFGYPGTAELLVRRGAPVDQLPVAAGLGRMADVERLFPDASGTERHQALALAAQLGKADAVGLLLDAGQDPDRRNPDGYHSHSTPLHQAALSGHESVVRLLLDRGARLDIPDSIYQGTPLDWARYGKQERIVALLIEGSAEPRAGNDS
jgi:ankyrin repeat protein